MTGRMRILTVRQPWTSAITYWGKDVENRSRNIAGDWRGPVAIHAAVQNPVDEYLAASTRIHAITGYFPMATYRSGYGAILGVADLVEVHHATDCFDELHGTLCSPWADWADADADLYHLRLANARTLPEPIPYKGGQGLRWLPDDVAATLRERLAP